MRPYFLLPIVAATLLAGCNFINNDIQKGLEYGNDAERLTRKVDDKPAPGDHKSKVNAYIWRASLTAVQSYPLITSDPLQGVIVTDWYSTPGHPDDRKQIRIDILGADLRRDLVRVSIARQVQLDKGFWVDAPAPAGVSQKMEDTILFNARDTHSR